MRSIGTQYPQLSPALSEAIDQVVNGDRPDMETLNVAYQPFFHRQMYITAGTVAAALTFNFFNVQPAAFVSNWFGPSGPGTDVGVVLHGFGFWLDSSKTLAGAGAAAGSDITTGAAAPAVMNCALAKQWLLENGQVSFQYGTRTLVENVYGLHNFPSGCGIDGYGASASTVAGAAININHQNNGSPDQGNYFKFIEPVVLLPSKNVAMSVTLPAAYDGTTTSLSLAIVPQIYATVIRAANY